MARSDPWPAPMDDVRSVLARHLRGSGVELGPGEEGEMGSEFGFVFPKSARGDDPEVYAERLESGWRAWRAARQELVDEADAAATSPAPLAPAVVAPAPALAPPTGAQGSGIVARPRGRWPS